MTVNDFLKKYHRQAVYCNSFYIQFYSYLKNEMDIEFKCKLFKDERGTDMNILYKYSSCKIKNFSIKSFFCTSQHFVDTLIFLGPYISLYALGVRYPNAYAGLSSLKNSI